MRVAVVGAGFTGLAVAVALSEKKVQVDVFEKSLEVGGLAGGIKSNNWNWSLEYFYHHIFYNDSDIIEMSTRVGCPPIFYEPKTSSLINKKILQLDSPLSVLKFGELSIASRIRMGFGLAILKFIPNGMFLEKYKATYFLPKLIGNEAYDKIWKKLLKAKFGSFVDEVNMAWFWSRVAKRTKKLGYFEGGFLALATAMKKYSEKKGVKFFLGSEFDHKKLASKYDKIILTTPGPIVDEIVGRKSYAKDKLSLGTNFSSRAKKIFNERVLAKCVGGKLAIFSSC